MSVSAVSLEQSFHGSQLESEPEYKEDDQDKSKQSQDPVMMMVLSAPDRSVAIVALASFRMFWLVHFHKIKITWLNSNGNSIAWRKK